MNDDERGMITYTASEPLTDEDGRVVFLEPGTLDLGIVCVECGYAARGSCGPGDDTGAMMAAVRADFNEHRRIVHGQ